MQKIKDFNLLEYFVSSIQSNAHTGHTHCIGVIGADLHSLKICNLFIFNACIELTSLDCPYNTIASTLYAISDNHNYYMEEEVIHRQPIWTALSEFYLDTELDIDDFIRIKAIFDSSRFSLEEIKDIDLYEVFPLLQTNLLAPAGAWAGFDEPWLTEECTKMYKRRRFLLHEFNCKLWNLLFYWMRKRYWFAIEKLDSNVISK